MKQPSPFRVLADRVIGSLQKAQEFVDYRLRRLRMEQAFATNRRRHRRIFGGRVERILIVRLGSLGDVVRATTIVRGLRRAYPTATIDVLTSPAARSILADHPDANTIHTLDHLEQLGHYDWVVNLQNPEPVKAFLRHDLSYRDVLHHITHRLGARMISGRHLQGDRETASTDIHFCVSEMEELFLTALLDFDPKQYPETNIRIDPALQERVRRNFPLPAGKPVLGIFLGTNSVGRGADEGYRTYSLPKLVEMAEHFAARFTIVVFGQSQMRTDDELSRYRRLLAERPEVIDLVDRTSIDELPALIERFAAVITCDSSPVHLALARRVPVVALYVTEATFRMGPVLETDAFVAINSAPPCFAYSRRWKFFCQSCRDDSTRARYCFNDVFVFGVDRIPISDIDRAISRLVPLKEARACAR